MNKVNIILLIITMFTGFPAIVAFSQNVNTKPQFELSTQKSSSSSIKTPSIESKSSIVADSSSSLILSSTISSSSELASSSSEMVASSVIISSSSLLVEQPKPIITQVIKQVEPKPLPVQVVPKPIIKKIEEVKPVQVLAPEPIPVISSIVSSVAASSLIVTPPVVKQTAPEPVVANNLSYSDQIKARCTVLGCNSSQMIRIMMCESSGNPTIVGAGTYIGLFQFLPSTFNSFKVRAGLPNGNIYNGSDQIHVATYMFANGYASQWGCQ
jgi:Transglycosylase SLT domain